MRPAPLILAMLLGITAGVANAQDKHDLKWNFGAFASVQIVDDLQLQYCYNAERKPKSSDSGMYIYTPLGDDKYEVKIDSGTFTFSINDAGASAVFVNTQGQQYTAGDH